MAPQRFAPQQRFVPQQGPAAPQEAAAQQRFVPQQGPAAPRRFLPLQRGAPPDRLAEPERYDSVPAGPPPKRRTRHLLPVGIALVVVGALIMGLAWLRLLPGSPIAASAAPTAGPSANSAAPPTATATPTASPTASPPALAVRPGPVRLNVTGWFGWALLDQRSGEITGSANMSSTSTTASLIKAWIAADYLRRAAKAGQTPSDARMRQLTIMIRDSDNEAAQALWGVVGEAASIRRLISICDLTDSSPYRGYWSNTALSPRDTARMGACIADGRAAGPKWTTWLLREMRLVRGIGDFGIRKAFPAPVARTIAIKNGWVTRDNLGEWHVNCLAIGDGWTMGVMTRYPARLGYEYGAKTCERVARQLRTP